MSEHEADRDTRPGGERPAGGHGDDASPSGEAVRPDGEPARTHGDSAVGRENPSANPADADEALGNRVGGYGREPEESDGTGVPDGD